MSEISSSAPPLRWGVLGAARILRKVVPAIRAAGGNVVTIGTSRRERARAAAAAWDIPRVVEGYGDVVADDSLDAIYLPLANALHHEWLLATAAAGKHCLCEKPLTLTAAEAREARAAFARAGRRLMEAFMWRHHPQIARVRKLLAPEELGEPRRLHATFSFPLDRPHDYRWKRAMGGGALLDLGCYGVSAARYFFGREPVAVSARARFTSGDDGVDESTVAWLDFGDGCLATVTGSFTSAFAQGVEVTASDGTVRLTRPWLSGDAPVRIDWHRGGEHEAAEIGPADAYRNMVEHFTGLVRDPSRPLAPAEDGTRQAVVLEGLRMSAYSGGAVIDLSRSELA